MRKPEGKRLDTEMILEGEDEGDISGNLYCLLQRF